MAAVNHEIHDKQASALGVTALYSESLVDVEIPIMRKWLFLCITALKNEKYKSICAECTDESQWPLLKSDYDMNYLVFIHYVAEISKRTSEAGSG